MRKVTGVIAVVVGLGLIVMVFALQLFDRTDAAGHLTASVRPAMSKQFLDQLQASVEEVRTGVDDLGTKVIPAVASLLKVTPAQLEASIQAKYPDITEGLQKRQAIFARYTSFVTVLQVHRTDYTAANSLPIDGLPMRAGAWGTLGLGVALVVCGLLALATRGRTALLLILGLGLAAVVFPLVASFPSKSSKTGDLVDALRTPMSRSALSQYEADLDLARRFIPDVLNHLLPDTASALGVSRPALDQQVASISPALAKAIPDLPRFLDAANLLISDKLATDVPYFQNAKDMPVRVLPWMLIGPGALLAMLATLTLVPIRRPVTPVSP